MPRHPKSAPASSQPIPPTLSEFRTKLDGAGFDVDFSNLVARIAAHGGGTLSLVLCAELALEIVLQDIADQACAATGASGAAIVLRRDQELVCRARSGEMAPELGARFDGASGLSGECLRTRRAQRCDDVLLDSRADPEASERLGVRSVIVVPMLRGTELAGVFELFSSQPHAFGNREERSVEALAGRTLNNLERAAEHIERFEQQIFEHQRLEHQNFENHQFEQQNFEHERIEHEHFEKSSKALPVPAAPRDIKGDGRKNWFSGQFNLITGILAAGLLVCAIWLGALVGRHLGWQRESVRRYPNAVSAAPASAPAPVISTPSRGASNTDEGKNLSAKPFTIKSITEPSAERAVPPGSLLVFENEKEVFRLPPGENPGRQQRLVEPASTGQGSEKQGASAGHPLARADGEGILLHRVEPEYPEEARRQRVQGVVVLEVHVGPQGEVQDVEVVSGPPLLAEAATKAVKQWRFKTRSKNGRAVEMQSSISLNFRLPQ